MTTMRISHNYFLPMMFVCGCTDVFSITKAYTIYDLRNNPFRVLNNILLQ